jgi:hypothetical protein
MIKATYRDNAGFTYKSNRSKSSEVKSSFAKVVTVKSNPVQETDTRITYKSGNLSLSYNKVTGVLTVSKVISKALNKYGKEIVIPVSSQEIEGVTVDTIASYV